MTTITAAVNSTNSGTVNGAANCELRELTVVNTANTSSVANAIGVYGSGANFLSLWRVNVTITTAGTGIGVFLTASLGASFHFVNAYINGQNGSYGIQLRAGSDSVVIANSGLYALGLAQHGIDLMNCNHLRVDNSDVEAINSGLVISAISNDGTPRVAAVRTSTLYGGEYSYAYGPMYVYFSGSDLSGTGSVVNGGVNICAGVYNGSFVFYPSSCP
jgi:hypothetical protein